MGSPCGDLGHRSSAFAVSSIPETITATGNGNSTPGEVLVSFSCAMNITYEVQGASGGGAQANGRGRGASQRGTLFLPAGVALRLVGGGRGAAPQGGLSVASSRPGGRGYGNGGDSGTAIPVGGTTATARAAGGGGAGSAILTSSNTPIVVSAGGGGIGAGVSGSWQQYPAGAVPVQEIEATGALQGGGNGRAPGDPDNDAGETSNSWINDIGSGSPLNVYVTKSGISGGAKGATGGTATPPVTTYTQGNLHEAWIANKDVALTGAAGGNFGAGSYGGGNGAKGSNSSTAAPADRSAVAASAAGGGGGYAGGAGGNSFSAFVERVDTDNGGADPRDAANYSTGTGGGAGSSYRADTVAGGITTASTAASVATTVGEGFAASATTFTLLAPRRSPSGGSVSQTSP